MARTGQTLKYIFNNAEEILDRTVNTYKENCLILGYHIAYSVMFKDQQSLIYKLQVSNSSLKNFVKYDRYQNTANNKLGIYGSYTVGEMGL